MSQTPLIFTCILFVLNGICATIPDRWNFNLWVNLPVTIMLFIDMMLRLNQ